MIFETKSILSIYPNPADEAVILNYDGAKNIEVQVFDIKGSKIKSVLLNGESKMQKLMVSDLINGTYIINVLENGKKIGTEKISVQH